MFNGPGFVFHTAHTHIANGIDRYIFTDFSVHIRYNRFALCFSLFIIIFRQRFNGMVVALSGFPFYLYQNVIRLPTLAKMYMWWSIMVKKMYTHWNARTRICTCLCMKALVVCRVNSIGDEMSGYFIIFRSLCFSSTLFSQNSVTHIYFWAMRVQKKP